MPSINLSCYLTEEEYSKYIKDRTEINKKARKVIKKEIS